MAAALALARRAVGTTSPNPAVAALIVRDGRLLARGVTAPGGRPHAEAVALAALAARGEPATGASAYVTLEPCAHHGLTPPCADALVAAGIARVVCPLSDPDPRVSGRGFARLAAAGVAVETGLGAAQARAVNEGFLSRIARGRPHLTLKLATTLDGRIATRTGESRWITGPDARRRVHAMRARADAVMVGVGTAAADDPSLDARGVGARRQPARVVIDPRLRTPSASRLGATATGQPVWLLHGADAPAAARDAWTALGARTLPCPEARGALDLAACLRLLAAEGVGSVLCEGGAGLAASLLEAGLVDRVVLFQAGRAIGAEGVAGIGPLGLDRLAEAPDFALAAVERAGADVVSVWERD
ncbi:MAG: bifunctional diaminohydroxyphosphoribosylaminopyrimidine deaminase/5-amino-6-(5-phosphoribosylamino)uracil reductase RibD [Paracoccaceae bacterium]